jgi:hypothetical protein
MKRLSLGLTAFAIAIGLASLAPRPAAAETSVSIGVNLGGPPPVVVWRREPRLYIVPGTSVYCYNDDDADYDYFQYGTSFYIFSRDRWYRAPSWRGPFVYIREEYVPRAFYALGDRGYRWRHAAWRGVPPGQFRRAEVHRRNEYRRDVRRDVREDRHDRKEHKGHGKHGGGDDD